MHKWVCTWMWAHTQKYEYERVDVCGYLEKVATTFTEQEVAKPLGDTDLYIII